MSEQFDGLAIAWFKGERCYRWISDERGLQSKGCQTLDAIWAWRRSMPETRLLIDELADGWQYASEMETAPAVDRKGPAYKRSRIENLALMYRLIAVNLSADTPARLYHKAELVRGIQIAHGKRLSTKKADQVVRGYAQFDATLQRFRRNGNTGDWLPTEDGSSVEGFVEVLRGLGHEIRSRRALTARALTARRLSS